MNQADNPIEYPCSIRLKVSTPDGNINDIMMTTQLPVKDNKLVFYRSSSAKAKDFLTLYFHQLFLQVWQQQNIAMLSEQSAEQSAEQSLEPSKEQPTEHQKLHQVTTCHGFYFDTKKQKVAQYRYGEIDDASKHLVDFIEVFLRGQQHALLLNAELAEKYFKGNAKGKVFEQSDFEKLWSDANAMMSLGDDPYMHYFWPECPQFEQVQTELITLYENMITTRELVK